MRKISYCTAIALVFICLSFHAFAQENDDKSGVKVVEMFTSQGCPACPPADRLLKDVTREYGAQVITLGCHVTYFDSASFEDPLSKVFCDARQEAYKMSGVSNKLYTPQAVVQGQIVAIGNHEDDVKMAIQRAPVARKIEVSASGGYLDLKLPAMELQKPADVWLVSFGGPQETQVAGGPNAGKTVFYEHPVTDITKLLSWNGQFADMSYPLRGASDGGYAVIVQDQSSANIIAAGMTRN